MRAYIIYIYIMTAAALLGSCRNENEIFVPDEISVNIPEYTSIHGFYLLNEGNMGSNKATLDYYDYTTGTYTRNSRLWAVINCSNKVEVMDAATARRIGQVDIANCRYIRFHEGYAYVTSYAGPVVIKPDYEQRGFVAKIDTATLQIVDTCLVGFQPDELEIADGKIYVANSGGYMVPNYENTVSVIDLNTFREVRRIPVAINLHHLRADRHGQLWVSSRGDYYGEPSRLYCINIGREQACTDYGITDRALWLDSVDVAVSNFHIDGDSLYLYSGEWSYQLMGCQKLRNTRHPLVFRPRRSSQMERAHRRHTGTYSILLKFESLCYFTISQFTISQFSQVRRWVLNAKGIAKALSVVGEAGLTNKSLRAKWHRNYQKLFRNFSGNFHYELYECFANHEIVK